MKTLVLGLGNTILCDDGIGIHVAEEIRKRCRHTDVIDASAAGFRVIDEIVGYDRLILIDSIQTGKAEAGTLHCLPYGQFSRTLHHTSPHDISLFAAFAIMKNHGEKLPEQIKIYAVEALDNNTFSEHCTPRVAARIPEIAEEIIRKEQLV